MSLLPTLDRMLDIARMRNKAEIRALYDGALYSRLDHISSYRRIVLRVEDSQGYGPYLKGDHHTGRTSAVGRLQESQHVVFGASSARDLLFHMGFAPCLDGSYTIQVYEADRSIPFTYSGSVADEVCFARGEARVLGTVHGSQFDFARGRLTCVVPREGVLVTDGWRRRSASLGGHDGIFEAALGATYYLKVATDPEHARQEVLASRLYTEAGITVPKLRLAFHWGQLAVVSLYYGGLRHLYDRARGDRRAWAGFVVDCWLANWDVVGAAWGNLMEGSFGGDLVRIDVGGSLGFRALGARRDFGPIVTELDTMADPSINPTAAAVFDGIDRTSLAQGAALVARISPARIKQLADECRVEAGIADALIARQADIVTKLAS